MRYYDIEEYNKLLKEIEEATQQKTAKTSHQYHLLKTYEVYVIGDTKKIISKRQPDDASIRYLLPYEDIFDALLKIHKEVGHKARDIMQAACSKRYINLTIDLINSKTKFYLIILIILNIFVFSTTCYSLL
jgi:hypothetical protein